MLDKNDLTGPNLSRSLQFAILREAAGESLREQAQRDSLTGLPNRLVLEDRLDSALARGRRYQTQTALMYLDLNSFKAINDTNGHVIGDALLKAVADRLNHCVRE